MTESKNYSHTSTGSKRAIFTFIATFIICLFVLDNPVSLFTGLVFTFAGMFTASVAVAMPFYFYKKKHLKIYPVLSMMEFLITITLTVMSFLYFFAYPLEFAMTASQTDTDSAYILRCNEPIPEFTMGMDIIPSKVQATAACSCIWKKLSPSDRNLSASLARNERSDASVEQLSLFTGRFNLIMEHCRIDGL